MEPAIWKVTARDDEGRVVWTKLVGSATSAAWQSDRFWEQGARTVSVVAYPRMETSGLHKGRLFTVADSGVFAGEWYRRLVEASVIMVSPREDQDRRLEAATREEYLARKAESRYEVWTDSSEADRIPRDEETDRALELAASAFEGEYRFH